MTITFRPVISNSRRENYRYREYKKLQGFSLIEIFITIFIVSIITVLAIPSLNTLIANNRMQEPINELTQAIQFARNQAISSGQAVYVCSSTNPRAGNPRCNGNDEDWGKGILVFQRATTSIQGIGNYNNNNNDTLLRRFEIEYQNGTTAIADDIEVFGFENTGLIIPTGTTLTAAICDNRDEDAGHEMTISSTGKISRKQGDKTNPIDSCTP